MEKIKHKISYPVCVLSNIARDKMSQIYRIMVIIRDTRMSFVFKRVILSFDK